MNENTEDQATDIIEASTQETPAESNVNADRADKVFTIGEIEYDFLTETRLPEINKNGSKNLVHDSSLENEQFLTPAAFESNSNADRKVFAIGEIGYDFLTETNVAFFQKAMNASNIKDSKGEKLELIPSNELHMAKFLSYKEGQTQPYMENCTALTWILKIDGIPVYAVRPQNAFAMMEFSFLVNFLMGKYGIDDSEIQSLGNDDMSKALSKESDSTDQDKISRVSIAGSIVDEIRLYNGQVVPVISPVLRGMFTWSAKNFFADKPDGEEKQHLVNFLDRIYYELRNRGAAPHERAINYAATNAYQAEEIFKQIIEDEDTKNYQLNKISSEKSPVCRPGSDCWDVVFEFFDPANHMRNARKIYRYTIDVSEIMPVTFGKLQHWYAY